MTIADPLFHFRSMGADVLRRYKKRGEQAKRGLPSACVVLKCVECSGGEFKEALHCKITTCPLYPLNERYMKRKSIQKSKAQQRRRGGRVEAKDDQALTPPPPSDGGP